MSAATQKIAKVAQLLRNCVGYLYLHSRVQFHPALYVLLYATLSMAIVTLLLLALGLVVDAQRVVDYKFAAIITGCLAAAELTRAHVKLWLGVPPSEWSFVAIAAGGAALGVTFWVALLPLEHWGTFPAIVAFATASYLFLGYLFRLCEKPESL
jgi:hypothetical protein